MAAADLLARARADGTPLVDGDRATFVWTGERVPVLTGDMTGWTPWEHAAGGEPMHPVADAVWACTLTVPRDAYLEYVFQLDGQRVLDPLNPRHVPNGFGQMNNCFWMPEARRSSLFRRGRDVPAGPVEPAMLRSPRLAGGSRRVRLYRSPQDGPYRFLLVLDGTDYFHRARLATLVDNLGHQGALPPLAIGFLDNAGRARFVEYACSEALVGFVADELIPWVAGRVPLVRDPGAHAVLGASLGGLAALWLGVRLPELFGAVLSQAGAFRLRSGGELGLLTLLRASARLPLRIHLDCGVYDPLLGANRAMRAVVEERGYRLDYVEFNAGHNYPAWRERLPDALPWLYAGS